MLWVDRVRLATFVSPTNSACGSFAEEVCGINNIFWTEIDLSVIASLICIHQRTHFVPINLPWSQCIQIWPARPLSYTLSHTHAQHTYMHTTAKNSNFTRGTCTNRFFTHCLLQWPYADKFDTYKFFKSCATAGLAFATKTYASLLITSHTKSYKVAFHWSSEIGWPKIQ